MPQFQFDAYQAYEDLKTRYVNYLLESFGIASTPLGDRLRHSWTAESDDHFRLFAPLHVEGAFPFEPVKTVEELKAPGNSADTRTTERPLHPKTVRLLQDAGFDFELYDHQVEAIQKASTGNSIVLSAGTGSGKTEAFLIPLIDQLFWAQQQGQDDLSEPGVRSIIIYPLNALVNNQIERLRELLSGQTEINFAFYTSRLKETHRTAKNDLNTRGRELPPKCQIVDRQTLRGLDGGNERPKGPPHILVTNFSMLEYMLVRPKDRSIFLNQHLYYQGSPRFQSVVLDEAHVYEGAQAAEIHMLLRRAARRFGTQLEKLQGFATSATLRQGNQSGNPLKDYAGDMFAKDNDEISAVEGERHLPAAARSTKISNQGLTPPSDLPEPPTENEDRKPWIADELRTLDYDDQGRATDLVEDAELAQLAKEACIRLGVSTHDDAQHTHDAAGDIPAKIIHELFAANETLSEFRSWLFDQEELPALDDVARKLYVTDEPTERIRRAAHAVLRLGSLGRSSHDQHPFLPSRMHAMVRAPLGIWVDPNPDNAEESTELSRNDWPWGRTYAVPPTTTDTEALPLLVCKTCGSPFLLAWNFKDDFGEDKLSAHDVLDANPQALFHNQDSSFRLPEKWGRVPVETLAFKQDDPTDGGQLDGCCPSCDKQDPWLSPLRRSAASALGAIVDGIYPHLGEHPKSEDDPHLPGKGRRMMTFSDSRQGAAKVASNVEATHDIGVNRQLLWKHVKHDETLKVGQLISDLYNPYLLQRAPANELGDLNNPAFDDLARLAVFDEFARPPAHGRTLETMGLVEVLYPDLPRRPDSVTSYLSSEQWQVLLAVVLDDARRRGAVRLPAMSAEGTQHHLHQLKPRFIGKLLTFSSGIYVPPIEFTDEDEDKEIRTIPLVPAEEHHRQNSRIVQYTESVLNALGVEGFSSVQLLREVWSALLGCANDYRFPWLRTQDVEGEDKKGISIDLERLELRPHREGPDYIEPVTGRVHFRSIKGISPMRDAPGPLREMTQQQRDEWRHSHSVKRVRNDELLGLYSVEHTAQLDVDKLEAEEDAFRNGERNLLASSTTMELGVDLGGLTCVILTNVPPGPANYWQRAGRAGRRADGSSLVLTLGLDRPHDQKVFRSPLEFFHDDITPPKVRLDTPPLISRHVNSLLLSKFFQDAVEPDESGGPMQSFGTLESFIFGSAQNAGGMREEFRTRLDIAAEAPLEEAYYRWLDMLDENHETVTHLKELVSETSINTWTISQLLAESRKLLEQATEPARHDHEVIDRQIEYEEAKGEAQQDQGYLRALKYQRSALRNEHLIGYLARTNFLPRFGFPLEVVKLNTQHRLPKKYRDNSGASDPQPVPDLRMERQLEIALREYAPGSDVIAGKRVHRVQGLERNWFQEEAGTARRRFYLKCQKCGNVEDRDAALQTCPLCGHSAVQKDDFVADMQQGSENSGQDSDALFAPDELADSLVRPYLKPSGFSVKVGNTPKRAERVHRVEKMPPAEVTFSAPEVNAHGSGVEGSSRIVDSLHNRLEIKYTSDATVFIRAEGNPSPGGHSYGFAICQACGFTEPEESWGGPLPKRYVNHQKLRGRKECGGSSSVWRNAVLGTTQDVDAVEFRLNGDLYPNLQPEQQRAFFATLASCLKQVAAQRLQVDARTLSALVGTYSGDSDDYRLAAVVYEESGSGLLEHLCNDALQLLVDVADMLQNHEDNAAFIQFDSQFLAKYGRFRVDLLRRHFVEEGRIKLLGRDEDFDHDRMRLLQGASPRMAALRLLESGRSVALQAPQLADDAFTKEGLMRAVHQRVLDTKRVSTRLLLAQLPDPAADGVEQVDLARKLRAAIDDGLDVRVVDNNVRPELENQPWEILDLRDGYRRAIGGLSVSDNDSNTDDQPNGAFGGNWLSTRQAIEAAGPEVDDACQMHELLWESARSVDIDELVPEDDQNLTFVDIAAGTRFDDHDAAIDELLCQRAELGDLSALGEVEAIAYADKYVVRRITSMWMLNELLESFDYAPDAQGFVVSLSAPKERSYNASKVQKLLSANKPKQQLSRKEAQNMERSVRTKLRNQGLLLSFEKPNRWLPHPRKLMVRFSDAAELDTLRIRFEKGLDFLSPTSGTKSWNQREQAAAETYILVERNPEFTARELEQLGLAEKGQIFL